MSDSTPTMQTMAACDRCGRGYVRIAHDGVRCMAGDGGRLWTLPQSEPIEFDDREHRERRVELLASLHQRVGVI